MRSHGNAGTAAEAVDVGTDPSWVTLVVVGTVQALVVLDVSVLNVALPAASADLALSAVEATWAASAYGVTFAALLVVAGRLVDRVGGAHTVLVGVAVFVGASALGASAWTGWTLVAARAAQGVGAALVVPAGLAVVSLTYTRRRRARAFAVWGALGSTGGAAGGVLGGLLTEVAGWRAVLAVNVLVAATVLPGLLRLQRREREQRRREHAGDRAPVPLDGWTAALLALALGLLVHGLPLVGRSGWAAAEVVGALVVGTLAARRELRAPDPLLPLGLLRSRTTGVGTALVLLSAGAMGVASWYFLSFFMQGALGLGPWEAGLGFLPHTLLGAAVGVGVTPWLVRHAGVRRLVTSGALVSAVGYLAQALVPSSAGYLGAVLLPAVAMSVGAGLFVAPVTAVCLEGQRTHQTGAAAGLMSTAKQVGGVLGVAGIIAAVGGPADDGRRPAFAVMAALMLLTALGSLRLPATAWTGGKDRDEQP